METEIALLTDHNKDHESRISALEAADRAAVLGCPFYPGRGNGNDTIHRIEMIERTIGEAQMGVKWFWRGLIGFGITNLILAATILLNLVK